LKPHQKLIAYILAKCGAQVDSFNGLIQISKPLFNAMSSGLAHCHNFDVHATISKVFV